MQNLIESYDETDSFADIHPGFVLPRPHPWRRVKREHGTINGLPQFEGWVFASNGPLVLIETVTGVIHIGHKDWFIKTKLEPAPHAKRAARLPEHERVNIDEFV
jgi:hypothetical protein